MPSPADFRRAFGLEQGAHLGPSKEWQIVSLHVGHNVQKQNEEYQFPIELEAEWCGGTAARGRQLERRGRQLAAAFQEGARAERIVYSAYGSPYECTFGRPSVDCLDSDGRSWRLACLGMAVRRRDIPTLKQQEDKEREERGEREVTKEEERRYLGGYRVIRSRFGTSKCAACGQPIRQGAQICKEEGATGAGGWAHATCVLRQVKEAAGEEEGMEEMEPEDEGKEETGVPAQKGPAKRGTRSRVAAQGGASARRSKGSAAGPGVRGVVKKSGNFKHAAAPPHKRMGRQRKEEPEGGKEGVSRSGVRGRRRTRQQVASEE